MIQKREAVPSCLMSGAPHLHISEREMV